jgi:hypothetical protein
MSRTVRFCSMRAARASLAGGVAAGIAALLASAPAAAEPISYVRVLQTDASGRPNGPVFFETIRLPAPVVPLYLAGGAAPGPDASFINAGGDSPASVWLDLDPGLHTFTMVANQGSRNMTHVSMTLAFGSEPQTARIGVLAPFWTDQTDAPGFAVNPVVGGSLSFDDGQRRYELTDFFFASGSRYPGLDRVNDFGVGADGARDAIGQFTLRVTDSTPPIPEPGTLPMMLLAGVFGGLLWRLRSAHGAHGLHEQRR